MTQQIRPSQFITTYGPGAILEGPDGPRVIPSLAALFGDNGRFPQLAANYEISEPRLAALLGPTAGIVRIPTNAELGWHETREVYRTQRFPTWSLCAPHGILYQVTQATRQGCPRCQGVPNVWDKAAREAIRFVMACRDGHLDDVNWHGLVAHRQPGCQPAHYRWVGGGAALRFVQIECPTCGGATNLGTAYARPQRCSGRFPERMIPLQNARPGCATPGAMLQKGASNLRIPLLQAALTIPRLDTRLHLFLAQSNVRPALVAAQPQSMQDLLRLLGNLQNRNMVSAADVALVGSTPWAQVGVAINDVINPTLPQNYRELLDQEFRELRTAAANGAPARPSPTPGSPPCFEVIRSAVIDRVRGPGGIEFRVAPVSRLRVVLVQRGYQRIDDGAELVPTMYTDPLGNRQWYPGVELFGEGIFVEIDPHGAQQGRLPLRGGEVTAWRAAFAAGTPPVAMSETHPVHVWWHTLAHRLLNALAVDSGYSAAALRERIYIEIDATTGDATGGLLLYTVQPGGDGTLGGLISLAPSFAAILAAALRNDLTCSNDPLCEEERFDPTRVNGAACYACLLTSETSCEHRNRWLDRNLLLANLP